jgi:hypothetical protein
MKTTQELNKICDRLQYASLILGAMLVLIAYFKWDENIGILYTAAILYLAVYFSSVEMIFPRMGVVFRFLKTNLPVKLSPGRIARLFLGAFPILIVVLVKMLQFGQ